MTSITRSFTPQQIITYELASGTTPLTAGVTRSTILQFPQTPKLETVWRLALLTTDTDPVSVEWQITSTRSALVALLDSTCPFVTTQITGQSLGLTDTDFTVTKPSALTGSLTWSIEYRQIPDLTLRPIP